MTPILTVTPKALKPAAAAAYLGMTDAKLRAYRAADRIKQLASGAYSIRSLDRLQEELEAEIGLTVATVLELKTNGDVERSEETLGLDGDDLGAAEVLREHEESGRGRPGPGRREIGGRRNYPTVDR